MSQKKNKAIALLQWLGALVLLTGGVWFWAHRQLITDTVAYVSYQPTAQIQDVAKRSKLTDEGRFYFYASKPELEKNTVFNNSCQRKEAKSPILGCYTGTQIYLFDVTDQRLEGIEEVTAAHEMLHAVYDRLSSSQKEHVDTLLQRAYDRVKTPELTERMSYYQRAEPGEYSNELHSILPTEFSDLGPKLEAYYKQYFSDRAAIVALHEKVQAVYEKLDSQSKALIVEAKQLQASVKADSATYAAEKQQLNNDIDAFKQRNNNYGFTSQAEYDASKAELDRRIDNFNALVTRINANIDRYNTILKKLDSINAQISSLNRSIDSTITPAPTL